MVRLVITTVVKIATMTISDVRVGTVGTCGHTSCAQCRPSLTPMKARIVAKP